MIYVLISDKYDQKHPEDHYKSGSKKVISVLQKDEAVYRQDDSTKKKPLVYSATSYASSDQDNDHRSTTQQRKSSQSKHRIHQSLKVK